MTRDEIIAAQTINRSQQDALIREWREFETRTTAWTPADVARLTVIQSELARLSAEFKALAKQRVAH